MSPPIEGRATRMPTRNPILRATASKVSYPPVMMSQTGYPAKHIHIHIPHPIA